MHPVAQRLHGALARRPWLAPSALAGLAAVVLLVRLGDPGRIMFDETYYVTDARGYLETGVEPGFAVHPTVGKWLIAATMWLVGDTPVGWRLSGALAGIAIVVLTYFLSRRLLRDSPEGWWLALLAPLLLLADGLFLTQARIAMLDIHLALFAVAGLHVLVVDHHRRLERGRATSLRWVAGVLFGLAIGVKWSGLLALGGAGLLTLGWEVGAVREDGWGRLPTRLLAVTGSLVLVPAVVYAATWLPWLANFEDTFTYEDTIGATCDPALVGPAPDEGPRPCEVRVADRVRGLVRHHDQIMDFHLGLEATHTYRSDPLGWPVLQRPVVYYWAACSSTDATAEPTFDPDTGELRPVCEVPEGEAGEVLSVGNPALWWGFVLLSPLLVAGTVLRDGRSAVPLVGWLATWLPWLLVSRTAFLFYLTPVVPLLAIGVVLAVERLGSPGAVRRTYAAATFDAAVPLAVLGALIWFDVVEGLRLMFGLAALGWAVGAATGAVADRDRGPHGRLDRPPGHRTTARWAALVTLVVLATAVFFAPVWLALPIDRDAIELRWWFDTWI